MASNHVENDKEEHDSLDPNVGTASTSLNEEKYTKTKKHDVPVDKNATYRGFTKHNYYANSSNSKKYGNESKNTANYKYKNSNHESSKKTYYNKNARSNNKSFDQNSGPYLKTYNKPRKRENTNYPESKNKQESVSEYNIEQDKNSEKLVDCESYDNDVDNTIGCVVNGRYVRNAYPSHSAFPKVPTNQRSYRSNSAKHNSYYDNEQKYTGRTNIKNYSSGTTNRSEIHANNFHAKTTNLSYPCNDQFNQDVNQNCKTSYQNNLKTQKAECSDSKHKVNDFKNSADSIPKGNVTQRDRLIQQLEKGECECMVCCELIRPRDQVWNCSSCYHLFHLRCIKKWARSPTAIVPDCGWRCPACQNIYEKVPYNYYCFCGKSKEPEMNRHYLPHSCGEVCSKQRDDKNCNHRCNLLCHPGPCPPCSATSKRLCTCGKTSKIMPCNKSSIFNCDLICEKLLNCECHTCPDRCHNGECKPCSISIKQNCYCGKNSREVLCSTATAGVLSYCCNMICSKKLQCGFHECRSICHMDSCAPCDLLPNTVTFCPCGKSSLQELYALGRAKERTSCNDPIPICEAKCEKLLSCGPKINHHKCNGPCHTGECPICPLQTNVKCQCGSTSKEVPCADLLTMTAFQCEKRCSRRKECGRHKCLNICCTNTEHKCELICNKKLSCGSHQCQETCHAGKCPTCWNVSFDELPCHCGESVLYPPIHCGTKPPECNQPCARTHPCGHEVQHTCHSDPECPPCTIFTTKWCFGGHERHTHIPCFLDGISCGKPCNKALSCGRHKCREICHTGSCLKEQAQCTQLCEKQRSCGHPCATPCHDGDCPNTSCKAEITVSCPCGHRTEIATCSDDNNSYRLMSVSLLATKIQDIKAGESVNINDLLGKKNKGSRLQCNEECAVLERNKRLAVALQIQNPELSCKPGPPSYSEFLKEETKKNPRFVSNIYDKFVELVQLAKQSKQKSRSHAFPPMKRDQRRIVHEIAEFFGCETQSYDEEPVKNVVITAFRDKSWLPFVSLLTVVQRERERELGLRKGPTPLISQNVTKTSDTSHTSTTTSEKKEKVIDYFDFPG